MHKGHTLLLVGTVIIILLGACTTTEPAATEAQTHLTNTPLLPTSPQYSPTPDTSNSTPAFIPTHTSTESNTLPSTQSPILDICQGTNGLIDEIDASPSPAAGISVDLDRLIPPAPPGGVEAQKTADGVLLSWQGTGTDVDQFYQVYRMEVGDECWKLIGVEPVIGNNQGVYTFSIPDSDQPGAFSYAVTTIDIYGNESDISTAVQLISDS